MFVPVRLALREKRELFEDAFNRNVMIVSPATLLISLRTIASIWRSDAAVRGPLPISGSSAAP